MVINHRRDSFVHRALIGRCLILCDYAPSGRGVVAYIWNTGIFMWLNPFIAIFYTSIPILWISKFAA